VPALKLASASFVPFALPLNQPNPLSQNSLLSHSELFPRTTFLPLLDWPVLLLVLLLLYEQLPTSTSYLPLQPTYHALLDKEAAVHAGLYSADT
jgi:hypothetical protein